MRVAMLSQNKKNFTQVMLKIMDHYIKAFKLDWLSTQIQRLNNAVHNLSNLQLIRNSNFNIKSYKLSNFNYQHLNHFFFNA